MPTWELAVLLAAKGAVLLMLTAAAGFIFRRAAAATRHLVWTGGLIASLAVPLASTVGPILPVLPTFTDPTLSGAGVAAVIDWWPSAGGGTSSRVPALATTGPVPGRANSWTSASTAPALLETAPSVGVSTLPAAWAPNLTALRWPTDWIPVAGLIWLAGVLAVGLRLLAGAIAIVVVLLIALGAWSLHRRRRRQA